MAKKLEDARKERDFLKDLNGSLLRNQADLQKQLADAQAQLKFVTEVKQAAISDLEEHVRRCSTSFHWLWAPAGPWHCTRPASLPPNACGSKTCMLAQVRDLMVYIEVGRTVASNDDLQDAQVLPVPAPEPMPVQKRRSGRR